MVDAPIFDRVLILAGSECADGLGRVGGADSIGHLAGSVRVMESRGMDSGGAEKMVDAPIFSTKMVDAPIFSTKMVDAPNFVRQRT